MTEHSTTFSPSSAARLLACPPSGKLSAQYPDETSEYAQEGTDAHALCQYLVEKAIGQDSKDPTPDLQYYNSEMQECAENYCSFIMETVETAKQTCKDPVILVEQRLDFSRFAPGGFGTGDCVIVSDETLFVIDFKYGLGVLVDAEMNPQMLCYALGALELFDGIYDIENITMTIFQPRRDNISSFTISKEDLLKWATEVLEPAAKLAYSGEGEFRAGPHCQFCKARAECRKRAEYNLEMAKYDFAPPDTLDQEEITYILSRSAELQAWASDVQEYALKQALQGTKYEGYKIVESKSNRKYTDEGAVAEAVIKAGFDPYEQKLKGITAMTSTLGAKKFETILGKLVYKPKGKPALVPESDKRPAMNTAQEDFKEE
ncbi:MAG: DUF2800 domain-containing protein [Lachnospiraceae bacterium]|nr:DUF2800 domain-containing protein [Lachnospiraceae bacterium]